MKASLILLSAVSAVKISEPSVPKSYTPKNYYSDQLGWAGEYDMSGENKHFHDYNRALPTHFESLNDSDRFTRSMISDFAMEERNKDGSPSGKFFFTKDLARQASIAVLET